MPAGNTSKQTRDFNIDALPALGAPPARTDVKAMADVSDSSKVKKLTVDQDQRWVDDASVNNAASPSGTDRLGISSGGEAKYVTWNQIGAASGSPVPSPLNHNGWLSGTQYVQRPRTIGTDLTTIYLNPTEAGAMAYWNGSAWASGTFPAPVSLALGTTAVGFYEMYAYFSAGAWNLELSTVWTDSFRTRADAVAIRDGVYVKSSDHTRRLVGFIFVHATGKVNQGGPSPGVIPVQDMWNADEPHSWYGRHCGWAVPWHVCQILGENFLSRPLQYLMLVESNRGSQAAGYGRAKGWCYRYPHRMVHSQISRVSIQNPRTWMETYYAGSSTAEDINLNTVTNIGQTGNNLMEYDPVRDKWYMPDHVNSDFYKFGLGGAGSSAAVSSTAYLINPCYIPTQDKFLGNYSADSQLVRSFNPATDTFAGSGIAASAFANTSITSYCASFTNGYCPINDRFYTWLTGGTIAVINPGTEAIVASITLTVAGPNNTGNYGQNYFLSYIPTLRKMVAVYYTATGGGTQIVCAVIDPATNTVESTWLSVKSGQNSTVMNGAYYVPGWDVIFVKNQSGTLEAIDCRMLVSGDSSAPGILNTDGSNSSAPYMPGMGGLYSAKMAGANYTWPMWWPGDNKCKWELGSDFTVSATRAELIAVF